MPQQLLQSLVKANEDEVDSLDQNQPKVTKIPEKSAIDFDQKSDYRILKCTLLLNKSKYCEKISMIVIYQNTEKGL